MAIQEIHVGPKEGIDPRAEALNRQLRDWGFIKARAIQRATVYRFEGITDAEAEQLAAQVLTDPITQRSHVNAPLLDRNTHTLEIAYRPGVMNPVSESLERAAQRLGIHPSATSSSTEYYIQGHMTRDQLEVVGGKLASQVETVIWQTPETLLISGLTGETQTIPLSTLGDSELIALSNTRRLFLDVKEMQVIQSFFRSQDREPTDAEIETLAQTWSEHCGHKTFKAKLIDADGHEKPPLIKRIRQTAEKYFERTGVVTAFNDNAGGIRFYDGQVIIGKGETHNSPVAVEPHGGAMTKNGGVYRDIAGCGLSGVNILALMVNCLGEPDANPQDIQPGSLHHKHLLLENFRGEREYGNPMGIPTHATTLHFHPDFGPKPTSMGIVIGIIPEHMSQKGRPQPGNFLVTVGGKTGRDGIHGATFSSGAMTETTSTVDATAVQIGNPIEEKCTFDALIACRNAGLIQAVTDCGAGGYSSAVGEMGENVGVSVQLDQIHLKYAGLSPWEIWLSESQERMVVAVRPDDWKKFKEICDSHEASATVFGKFTDDGQLRVSFDNKSIVDMPMEFLHHGLPQRELRIEHIPMPENNDIPDIPTDWISTYKKILGHLNIASTEQMLRQFDTTVQARTVLHPFTGVHQDAPNDASVIAPMYGKPYGVVTSHAVNPLLNRLDPYKGTVWAVAMAAAKVTAVGGNIKEAAMIDNFVWPKPNPKFLGDLDRSVDALCDMMNVLEIPCVSGKDSLSSTYTNGEIIINIPPVLNITTFGRIPDVEETVSCDIKKTGSALVLVGKPDVNNLGGSIYFQTQGIKNTHVSEVHTDELPNVLHSIHAAIQTGNVKSCKAVGEGGLATMLAHMCFGGDCGATIDVQALDAARPDLALFNETAGTFIVEVTNEILAHELFQGVPYVILGKTTEEKTIRVRKDTNELFAADLYELKHAWQQPLKEVLS